MDNQILINIIFALSLVVALTIHEFSHAFIADHFGDPTPRSYGRLSLNPLRHLDPLGTFMLIFFKFGWGKPVPIDPYNLTKNEEVAVALAGPFSNFILAILTSISLYFLTPSLLTGILSIFIQTNLVLGVFNLLPIPPLDGSKVFLSLLPEEQSIEWQKAFDQYGFIILAVLLFLPIGGSNIISLIISPIISFLLTILVR
jgi:Zn-dependent protease